MTISITFTADSVSALNEQVWLFFRGSKIAMEPEGADVDTPREDYEYTERKPKKRAVKASLSSKDKEVAEAQNLDELLEEEDPISEETAPAPKDLDTGDLLALKAKMLAELQNAMAIGKIDKLRALLAEHGGGAKSFPEVSPEQFKVIKQAVDAGALN